MAVDGDVDAGLVLQIDLGVYRLTAIKKAAYRLANRFTAQLERIDDATLKVTLDFRRSVTADEIDAAKRAFHQELLDQELREHVAEETSSVRALIIAQAFSRTNLFGNE